MARRHLHVVRNPYANASPPAVPSSLFWTDPAPSSTEFYVPPSRLDVAVPVLVGWLAGFVTALAVLGLAERFMP